MWRVLFIVGVVLTAGLISGCAGTRAGQPPISVTISLGQKEYRIGEPLVATVSIENRGDERLVISRFDHDTIQFITGRKGVAQRTYREPVYSQEVVPQPRELKPQESVSRDFLFTQATCEAGDCAIIAKLKANKALVGSTLVTDAMYAEPVRYQVKEEVALRRGADGLVLKEQALELARTHAPGPVVGERAVLVKLGESRLVTWVAMLTVSQPDGTEKSYAVEVNPYTGKLRPLERNDVTESLPVPAKEAQPMSPEQAGRNGGSGESNDQKAGGAR